MNKLFLLLANLSAIGTITPLMSDVNEKTDNKTNIVSQVEPKEVNINITEAYTPNEGVIELQ